MLLCERWKTLIRNQIGKVERANANEQESEGGVFLQKRVRRGNSTAAACDFDECDGCATRIGIAHDALKNATTFNHESEQEQIAVQG